VGYLIRKAIRRFGARSVVGMGNLQSLTKNGHDDFKV